MDDSFKLAAAQIRPKWLDKAGTVDRAIAAIESASVDEIRLLVFPEAFVSGYPFWVGRTDGASFGSGLQEEAYSQFLEASVESDSPEVRRLIEASRDCKVSVQIGINERGRTTGRGTIYCSLLTIHAERGLVGVHRKLVPTFEERLVWSHGDAHDLKVHDIRGLKVGGLCCWENWMPLARFALYSGGEDLHVSVWPGSAEIARTVVEAIAREGRVWSLSVHGLLSMSDVPDEFVLKQSLLDAGCDIIFDGGSSLAAPDGTFAIEPVIGVEGLITYEIDLDLVRRSRRVLDPTGHSFRPDIFQMQVNGTRFDESSLWGQ